MFHLVVDDILWYTSTRNDSGYHRK